MGNTSGSTNNYSTPGLEIAVFIIVIAGVMAASSVITPLLLALFISIICSGPISWLRKKKIPQGLAISIVFIGILAIFWGFGEIIGSSLSSFSDESAQYEENLKEMGNTITNFLNNKGIHISTEEISKNIDPSKVMSLTSNILGQLGGIMSNALTIIFLALFLLLEMDSIGLKAKAIAKSTKYTLSYLNTIGDNIRHYLSIKTVTSLATGILIWIGLAIIGVEHAIIWALIAFLLNFIPTIGSIIAAIPAVLFALMQLGFGGVIWTGIVFIAVNMIIGNIVEPKLMGKGLGLSTFVVFAGLLFWGFVLGTVGMFLSVPLTMSIKIMLEQSPNTKWLAILLGTEEDATNELNDKDLLTESQ